MEWSGVTPHLTGLAHLATASPDGAPHVAVVMPYRDGDTLWVFTRPTSGKARNIAANGRVALMWQPSAEAYVYGDAELVHSLDDKRRLWARSDLPFDPAMFFGTADHPDHVLVRITPTRATVMAGGDDGIRRLTWRR
jgi:general stress protein 26